MIYWMTFVSGMLVGVILQSIKADSHCASCTKVVNRCRCVERHS